jgi:hypothetical protein
MIERDRQLELDWLRRAVVADRSGFVAATTARMDTTGRDSYGDTWSDRHPVDLIAEDREECHDIGGWSVLTAMHPALRADTTIGPRVDAHLAAAGELAARADLHLKQAAALAAQIPPL